MTDSVNKVRARLMKKAARIQVFMQSDLGKQIIDALEDEFYHGDLFDPDPLKTAYNLGRRDVVVFLKQLQNWRTDND